MPIGARKDAWHHSRVRRRRPAALDKPPHCLSPACVSSRFTRRPPWARGTLPILAPRSLRTSVQGEETRSWSPAMKGIGYFFAFNNSDKRSLALHLETDKGRAILRDLIARADVLIENLKPGALAKRGFSADELLCLNPRLVYCAVSGFGADSAYPGRAAFDTVIQAM